MTVKPKKHVCPHDPGLNAEEETAMQWLSQMLGEMTQVCSPEHKRRSTVAHAVIAKTFNKLHKLHDLVHVQEAELNRAELILEGLIGLPHQLGLVDDGNLN